MEAPLFEGVGPDDGRYSIIYTAASRGEEEHGSSEGQAIAKVLLIYPSNILVSYDADTLELL